MLAIHPSDEDVKPGSPLATFENSRLMAARDFPFLNSYSLPIYHTKNTTVTTHALILDTSNLHIILPLISRSDAVTETDSIITFHNLQ